MRSSTQCLCCTSRISSALFCILLPLRGVVYHNKHNSNSSFAGINAKTWSVRFSDVGSSCSCSSTDENDWEDPRVKEALLLFDHPFSSVPSVMISVNKIHTLKTAETHYEAKAVSVTTTGFILQFRVFDDTFVKEVEIDWMAIGTLL